MKAILPLFHIRIYFKLLNVIGVPIRFSIGHSDGMVPVHLGGGHGKRETNTKMMENKLQPIEKNLTLLYCRWVGKSFV